MPDYFKAVCVMTLLCCRLAGMAQTATASPYSIYGLGDPESAGFTEHASIGGVKYGLANTAFIGVANPASFSLIGKPVFKVDLSARFITLSSDTLARNEHTIYARNFSIGIPVIKRKNRWGAALGLMPWSKMGYAVEDRDTVDNFGEVLYQYEGSGEINRFYLGNAISLLNNINDTSGVQLALGLNASYIFGSLHKVNRVLPQDTIGGAYNTLINNSIHVGDFIFDAGLLYRHRLSDKFMFSIGGNYSFADSLKSKNTFLVRSYTGQKDFETFKDTIAYDTNEVKAFNPLSYGFGLGFYIGHRWIIGLDYSSKDWSEYAWSGQNGGLASSRQYSVGVQLLPDNEAVTKFFKIIRYRAGFRYANTRLLVKGRQLAEYGISFGLGIPLLKSQSPGSGISIGVETGARGENGNGIILEQFVNFNFGFTFTPHKFDRWFYRRKIN